MGGSNDALTLASARRRGKRPKSSTQLPPLAALARDNEATEVETEPAHVRAAAVGTRPQKPTTPQAVIDRAEIRRTRRFFLVGLVMAVITATVAPLLAAERLTTWIMIGGLTTAACGFLYLLYRMRRPETYREGLTPVLMCLSPATAVTSTVPFLGPFSPSVGVLVFGIFFNGLGNSLWTAIVTYVLCAGVHAVISTLVIAHVILDPGLFTGNEMSPGVQLAFALLIQMLLAGTFLVARGSRRLSLTAIEEVEKAVRAVAQREALLEESREELQRAMGDGRGRFSDQLMGTFRLGEVIGRGAMGEVYEGIDTRNDQPVAVKMLSHASLGNAQLVQRFLRELQNSAAISSPHVVRVLAVGEHPLPHLVMERLYGRDLAAILRKRRTLAPKQVVELLRQVGKGIAAAFEAGVIHRDLKPHNLFLVEETWKVLDFGVSRITSTSDTLTGGQLIGTPAYMAPEQARGGSVDHRTDLYALAAVAYRCITGAPLFPGTELADLVYRVVHTAPRRPSSHNELPRDVDLALAIGLAKEPGARFETAAELADALELAFENRLSAPLRVRGTLLDASGAWA
jgi:serine/threonine-protein kinase